MSARETLRLRPPTPDDLDVWLGVILAVDTEELGGPDYTVADVLADWSVPGFDLQQDAWVATGADGGVIGHASVRPRTPDAVEVDTYVLPGHEDDAEPALLDAALRRCDDLRVKEVHVPNISTSVSRGELIASRGATVVRRFHRMEKQFDTPPTPSPAVAGVEIRKLKPGEERAVHDTLAEAFRDHWGPHDEDYASFEGKFLNSASFDPDLWLVAIAGDEMAGALIGCAHPAGVGNVRQLGVRRAYRRRGIAEALLQHAFIAFAYRGWSGAMLGVDSENLTGATRLYERAGMRPAFVIDVWSRPGVAGD